VVVDGRAVDIRGRTDIRAGSATVWEVKYKPQALNYPRGASFTDGFDWYRLVQVVQVFSSSGVQYQSIQPRFYCFQFLYRIVRNSTFDSLEQRRRLVLPV
jgi:hypothetical protein